MFHFIIILSTLVVFLLLKTYSKQHIIKSNKEVQPPFTKLVYSDSIKTHGAYIIKSEKHKLRGKPDLIYKRRFFNTYIPIELKSGTLGKNNEFPRENDLMQLISYFFMIEEHFNCKVPYGKLVYNDCTFIVNNTRFNRKEFLKILQTMRNFQPSDVFIPNDKVCKSCTLSKTVCDFCE